MPEKKRIADKGKKYIGFELNKELYDKIAQESSKLCLKPSSFARMLIAERYKN
jgi:hypothetical protein